MNEAGRALIESGALGHLATIDPDGSPQVTLVWVGIDGDELVTAHLPAGLRNTLSQMFPANDWRINRELARLLVRLEDETLAPRLVPQRPRRKSQLNLPSGCHCWVI